MGSNSNWNALSQALSLGVINRYPMTPLCFPLQLRDMPESRLACSTQQQAWQNLHSPESLPRSGQSQQTFSRSSDSQMLPPSYSRVVDSTRLQGYSRGQEISIVEQFKRLFQCPYCEQKMTSKGSLVRHIRSHTGERPYKCSYCIYAALQKSDLDRHTRNRHRDQI